MRKVGAALVILAALSIAGVVGREAARSLWRARYDVRSMKSLLQVAKKLNENMPSMVDTETEIMNVGAAEATIIYNYRFVNIEASTIDPRELEAALRPKVVTAVCTNPKTREDFLNRDITMRYVYHDRNRQYLISFGVTKRSCN